MVYVQYLANKRSGSTRRADHSISGIRSRRYASRPRFLAKDFPPARFFCAVHELATLLRKSFKLRFSAKRAQFH